MKNILYKKVMIFGRPGSGKSTFAHQVATHLNLPLHHIDKHFFIENWVERNYSEFLEIQQQLVQGSHWVIDGNSIKSLEMRWAQADLVLYFNFPKMLCIWRLLKRLIKPNMFDDRAPGCKETINWSLLTYLWNFETRAQPAITTLKKRYPATIFKEIKSAKDLNQLKNLLTCKQSM